jgi:NAD(P)-dependent dehydrogenase (short-subunit alcohol dehydrogenase family)
MASLRGKVALVAGATRGAGRGIACMLGEAGATVYCTGRSTAGKPATPGRPETIDETADLVTARGGNGIPIMCDHTQTTQVKALAARIKSESGGLDILVNDIWGGDALTEFGKPFWQVSLEKGHVMLERAIFTHIITSHYTVPLMFDRPTPGLVVEVTDGNSFTYRGNIFYDLVKTSVIRLAFIMARELRRRAITSVAVTPGFLRSEEVLDTFGVREANWRDGIMREPNLEASETPFFVGRAIARLAADPDVALKNGRVLTSWDLAEEYDFDDVDGRRPHWGRYFLEKYGDFKVCDAGFYEYWRGGPIELVFPNWPAD